MKLGKYLRRKRFNANLTQAQVAEMIGVTTYYYSYLENDKITNPRPSTVEKIAKYTGLTVEQIRKML